MIWTASGNLETSVWWEKSQAQYQPSNTPFSSPMELQTTMTSTIFKRIHLRPVTILSFSLFSWSAAHATPFTQLLGAAESFFPKLLVLCMFWGIRPWSVSHQRAGILNISSIFIEVHPKPHTSGVEVLSVMMHWPAGCSKASNRF